AGEGRPAGKGSVWPPYTERLALRGFDRAGAARARDADLDCAEEVKSLAWISHRPSVETSLDAARKSNPCVGDAQRRMKNRKPPDAWRGFPQAFRESARATSPSTGRQAPSGLVT